MAVSQLDPRAKMSSIPSGTVTFLFTDIEGSTERWEHQRAEMERAFARQEAIMRQAIAAHDGYAYKMIGDAFQAAFATAPSALAAALHAQRVLHAEPWGETGEIRVRMALHTGITEERGDDYVGPLLNRVARLMSAGHGGQILLSRATEELVRDHLPAGASLRDLGEHQLKDIARPERIFQLVVPDLPSDFPPLKTLEMQPAVVIPAVGEEAPAPGESPFKGLRYFDEADADNFFGREDLTEKLVAHLNKHPLLVVVGASGSGKSSLVRAGLVPALRRGSNELIRYYEIHIITPTAHPLEALAESLTRDSESVTAATTMMDDFARDPRSLHMAVKRATQLKGVSHLLLIVDQFEELFTLCRSEDEQKAFVANLMTAAASPSPVAAFATGEGRGEGPTLVVLTLRADFYAHCARFADLRETLEKYQAYIGPMSEAELRRAIEEPAKRADWKFESGLVDLLLKDVGDEPGALPLLSHALLETWQRRRGRTLTFAGYNASGGVRGAISKTAESVYQKSSPEQQAIARNIFLRLTELGEGTQDTRRRAALSELIPPFADARAADEVLKLLADARLITTSEGFAEVAHEALIREWHTLREWLNENREGLRLHRHLTEAAQAWQKLNRDAGELYRGARLGQALEWARLNAGELNPLEREFLDASREQKELEEKEHEAQRQRELVAAKKLAEAEQRRANILRWVAIGSSLLLVVMIGLAVFAFSQRDAAENERRIAFTRELSVNSVNSLSADPERSILLALQAVSVSSAGGKPVLIEAEEALHRSVQASRLLLSLRGQTGGLWNISLSKDGKRLATGSNDETKIWDAATGKELLTIRDPSHGSTTFSPDGMRVAIGATKTATVWDVSAALNPSTGSGQGTSSATGKKLLTLCCHADEVNGLAFSPDGTRLATSSLDKTAKVWDLVTGKELLNLTGNTGGINHIAYSPDGKLLVTGGWADWLEHVAKVWDANSGQLVLTLKGHTSAIYDVTFSHDGKRIVTGSSDGTARIWDSVSGQLISTIFVPGGMLSIALSQNDTLLATGGGDGVERVWDVATGQLLQTLPGHTGDIWSATFSLDGTRLYTGSQDATVKVWDISPSGSREVLTLAVSIGSTVKRVDYSPDGKRLATASTDKTAKVWDALSGKELLTLSGHTGPLREVTYSPDGSRLATTSSDKTLKVWDAASGKELLSIPTASAPLPIALRAAFSPDGKWIAGGSSDSAGYNVKIWNAVTGKELLSLCCHPPTPTGVTFSPDGARLVTSGLDNLAKVWDVSTALTTGTATANQLLTLSGHKGYIYAALMCRLCARCDTMGA